MRAGADVRLCDIDGTTVRVALRRDGGEHNAQ